MIETAATDPGWADSTTLSMVRPWANRPPAVALVALTVYGLYAAIVIVRHGVESFALVAPKWLFQSHASPTIDRYAHVSSQTGYDGQFYLFEALDPTRAWHYEDAPLYRYTHIAYPMLARAVGGGQPGAIPYALVAVNVVAIAAGTLIVASYLARHGHSPWLASLYFLFPGVYRPFTFDLCEPLAFALVAGGLWLVTETSGGRSFAAAIAVFALAGLTRETTLVIPVVLGGAGLAGIGPVITRKRSAWLIAGCLGPYLAYRIALGLWLGSSSTSTPNSAYVFWPFGGLVDAAQPNLYPVIGVAFAGAILLGACLVAIRRRPWDGLLLALAVNLAVTVILLNKVSYVDYNAAGRLQIGVVILTFWSISALQATWLGTQFLRIAVVLAYLPMAYFVLQIASSGLRPG